MQNFETKNAAFTGMLDINIGILEAIANRIGRDKIVLRQRDTMGDFIGLTIDRISDLTGMIENETYRDWQRQELVEAWTAELTKRRAVLARLEAKQS